MIEQHLYAIADITSKNHPKRCVVFLISDDRRITAKDEFDKLAITTERHFRARFDAWVDGQINKKMFHGWDQSEFGGNYTNCFVFKCKENKKQRRLYGFLCHPKVSDNRYQICVLVSHAFKNEHETHETYLKIIEQFSTLPDVLEAIKDFFKEKNDGKSLDKPKH